MRWLRSAAWRTLEREVRPAVLRPYRARVRHSFEEHQALFAQMPQGELADYITQVLLPSASSMLEPEQVVLERDFPLGSQMIALAGRGGFTDAQVGQFATGYARACEREAEKVALFSGRVNFGYALLLLTANNELSASTVGSIFRQLWLLPDMRSMVMAEHPLLALVAAQSAPLPVIARVLAQADWPFPSESVWLRHAPKPEDTERFLEASGRFQQRAAVAYPDLAGLPSDLQASIISGFPIPADWFVDAFPMPAYQHQNRPTTGLADVWESLLSPAKEVSVA